MIGLKVTTENRFDRVAKATDKAAFKNLRHAAASISKDMKASLEKAEGASEPGSPPHTHAGTYLKRAVRFEAGEESAVIGPLESVVGIVGGVHERGEVYKGTDFPERPFAEPALERAIPRIGGDWRGSIGE